MGTVDNIYAINYLINEQLGRKGGKLVALFVDLKATFDSVLMGQKGVDGSDERERGLREGLAKRVEQVLRKTKSRVRIEGEIGDCFWTARGVR